GMKLFRSLAFKTLAVAVALSFAPATASLPLSPLVGVSAAKADPGWNKRRHYSGNRHYRGGRGYYDNRRYYGNRRYRGSDAGAAAVIGGIVGLGLGAAIASQPRYVEPAPRYYRAAPVYAGAPRPWTGEWYRYCAARYRSFDANSGTFQPYHGPRQLCR
ncbi:MAG: BA14K family protein, partial [Humidesulfovibrio sp.]|nr:BA14K family protein [Humidesulfovibrio sp.]